MRTRAGVSLFVRRLEGLAQISAELRETLLNLQGRETLYDTHGSIVRAGKSSDFCHLVLTGEVGHFARVPSGKSHCVGLYITGDACDLGAVHAPVSLFSLEAMTPSLVLAIPLEAIREALSHFPELGTALLAYEGVRTGTLSKWLAAVGQQTARSRLAHFLCELSYRKRIAGDMMQSAFQLDLRQEQIGEILGLTAVHVNRTIRSLNEERLVSFRSKIVEILDWQALSKLGGFSPDYLRWKTASAEAVSA